MERPRWGDLAPRFLRARLASPAAIGAPAGPLPAAPVARVVHHARARIDYVLSSVILLGSFALMLLGAPGLDYFLTSRDHGYQLCIATQILLGKVPGVDVITAYGPMAMYASAMGLRLSDSLIGETVLCAARYALRMFLIYRLVANHSSRSTGLMAAIFSFLLQDRFYKWYVWLIPLTTLWELDRYIWTCEQRRQRWAANCSLIEGLGWLFRLDMGTLLIAACGILMALIEVQRSMLDPRRVPRSLAPLGAAFSIELCSATIDERPK